MGGSRHWKLKFREWLGTAGDPHFKKRAGRSAAALSNNEDGGPELVEEGAGEGSLATGVKLVADVVGGERPSWGCKVLIDTGSTSTLIKEEVIRTQRWGSCVVPFVAHVVDWSSNEYETILRTDALKSVKGHVRTNDREWRVSLEKFRYRARVILNSYVGAAVIRERGLITRANVHEYFGEVFYREGEFLSATGRVQHEIVIPDNRVAYVKPRRYPQVFTQVMEEKVRNLLTQGIIRKRHLGHLLHRFKKFGLKASCEKSSFINASIQFMGHVLSPKPRKPPRPRHFLPNLADQMKRWNSLTKKEAHFEITEDMREVLEWAKARFREDPVLRFPKFSLPFAIPQTPVSDIERELLGVVWAVEHFRPYVWGRQFQIRTDHQPLVRVEGLRETSAGITRWMERLAYSFRSESERGSAGRRRLLWERGPCMTRRDLGIIARDSVLKGLSHRLTTVEDTSEQDQLIKEYQIGKTNHRGIRETAAHLRQRYYWLGKERSVGAQLALCVVCARAKYVRILRNRRKW
ncbi:hypothetical protein AAG570_014156 [Ranatra chinensis]|uniref:RNA-directed DNA polymerase n=1 Tax=Ranatra chinensis TaxID=642074 RepID=A0ABD0XRV9_9HEMI